MLMRNPKDRKNGEADLNTVELIDERTGEQAGVCTVSETLLGQMFPERPHRVRISLEGDEALMDRLVGAGIARAKALAQERGLPSRVYLCIDPEDGAMAELTEQFGFDDTDRLIRMTAPTDRTEAARLPVGCVIVRDRLEDREEAGYFLERYNGFYGEEQSNGWLAELRENASLFRILAVSRKGMAGEIVCWEEDGRGVLGFLDTSRRWRRMGIARCLTALAMREFADRGIGEADVCVRTSMTVPVTVLGRLGFSGEETLLCYPGIDVEPAKEKQKEKESD